MSIIAATNEYGAGLAILRNPSDPRPAPILDPDPSATFERHHDLGGGIFRYDFSLSGHPALATARVFAIPGETSTWRSMAFEKVTYFNASGSLALLIDDIGREIRSMPGGPKPRFDVLAEIGVGIVPHLDSADTIIGNDFADRINAFAGDDLLMGKGGDDNLFGNAGNDTISGGRGNDRLTGNAGADHFRFGPGNNGLDRITDFNQLDGGAAEGDVLEISAPVLGTFVWLGADSFTGGADNSEARAEGDRVQIDLDGDGLVDIRIRLIGLTSSDQVSEADFLFI